MNCCEYTITLNFHVQQNFSTVMRYPGKSYLLKFGMDALFYKITNIIYETLIEIDHKSVDVVLRCISIPNMSSVKQFQKAVEVFKVSKRFIFNPFYGVTKLHIFQYPINICSCVQSRASSIILTKFVFKFVCFSYNCIILQIVVEICLGCLTLLFSRPCYKNSF